jgi:predicted ribosome quality control (RQC) complex YloA/Tae2 family protein
MDQPREIAMDVRAISDEGVIMPEEVTLILEQLKDIKEAVRDTATSSQNTAVQVAQLTERMNVVQEIAERLDRAVNGNGTPGLKEMAKDHERRLKEIEEGTEEEGDWVAGVEASLEEHGESLKNIEGLHRAEKDALEEAERKKEEKRQAEEDSMRKFRWSMVFFGVTALIDLILKVAGLPR